MKGEFYQISQLRRLPQTKFYRVSRIVWPDDHDAKSSEKFKNPQLETGTTTAKRNINRTIKVILPAFILLYYLQ